MKPQFCPNCYQERTVRIAVRNGPVEVRGEALVVRARIALCSNCGQELAIPELENERLLAAYREFRNRHHLLTPDEIAGIRRQYGLSQRALSRLLGWGLVTVQRYERGALQDTPHNQILSSLNDPNVVLRLLDSPACKLTEAERNGLRARITRHVRDTRSETALSALEDWLTSEEPSEITGYRQPSLERLAKMMVYFADKVPGPYLLKVKLLKLMFYADFLHFARQGLSISGFPYAAISYGPVPDNYRYVLGWAETTGFARWEEIDTPAGVGEALIPLASVLPEDFSPSELAVMDEIAVRLGPLSGSQLKELSHLEPAWQQTPQATRISYRWASDLRAVPVVTSLRGNLINDSG